MIETPPETLDYYEGIRRNLLLLERLDADVTVPLEACRPFAGPLLMRGPVRDISVFRYIINNRGIWEPHLTEWISSFFSRGGDFIDAGANLGYFSILAGSLLRGKGRVVAFEPLGDHLEYCKANVRLNGFSHIEVLPLALWNASETKLMSGHGDDVEHMGGAHIIGSGKQVKQTQAVQCVPLDDLVASGKVTLRNLRLLKMDIEGAEPLALDGMVRTIEAMRPVIALELNSYCLNKFGLGPEAVWERLRALRYRITILPAEKQHQAVSRLPSAWPVSPLREYATLEQLLETSQALDQIAPPCFPLDLIAIPQEHQDPPI